MNGCEEDLIRRLNQLTFEVGPIRPPSEGGCNSLLLRFTCNCPWNLCSFCFGSPYARKKFVYREVEEIKRDIDSVAAIKDCLLELSWKMGAGSDVSSPLVDLLATKLDGTQFERVLMVWKWMAMGERYVFIQDADSLIMRTPHLVELLCYLKKRFPNIERITSYARAKSIYNKSREEMQEIFFSGLTRLHIGLESGDDEVLRQVKKGVTSSQHIEAGLTARDAGFEISYYIMPGLGGRERSVEHATGTARVISAVDPHFVRSRPLVPRRGTPLYNLWQKGDFHLLSPHQLLKEIRCLIEEVEFSGGLCFDHMRNPAYLTPRGYIYVFSQQYNGYPFPHSRGRLLDIIEDALSIPEEYFLSVEEIMRYEAPIYRL